jgi:cytoskeletal protein RodZ
MATLAARAHPGAVLTAPAKRAQAARPRASRFAGLLRALARRPGRSLALLLFVGAAGVILANALFLQKVRHPAPMLSAPLGPPVRAAERKPDQAPAAATPTPAATHAATAATAPVPPVRPSALVQPVRETQPRPPAAVTNVPRTAAASAPAPVAAAPRAAAAPRDPIADLINGDMRPPGDIRGVATAKSAQPRRTAEN